MKTQYILKPSNIHGIGVFTITDVRKGEVVSLWDFNDCIFVKKIDKKYAFFYERYCVRTKNGWWRPLNFNRMSLVWYLNHSKNPNLKSHDGGYIYIATRNIKAGKELTINYKYLDKYIDNSL